MASLADAAGIKEETRCTELPLSGTLEAVVSAAPASLTDESASEATRFGEQAAVPYGGTNTDSPVPHQGQSTSSASFPDVRQGGEASGLPTLPKKHELTAASPPGAAEQPLSSRAKASDDTPMARSAASGTPAAEPPAHAGGWPGPGLRGGPHLCDVEAAAGVVLSGQLRSQPAHVSDTAAHAGLAWPGAGSSSASPGAAAAGASRSGMSWSEAAEGVAAAGSRGRDGGPHMSSQELSRLGPGMASAAGAGPAAEIALTHAAAPDAPATPPPAHAVAGEGGGGRPRRGAAGLGLLRTMRAVPSDAPSRGSAQVQVQVGAWGLMHPGLQGMLLPAARECHCHCHCQVHAPGARYLLEHIFCRSSV